MIDSQSLAALKAVGGQVDEAAAELLEKANSIIAAAIALKTSLGSGGLQATGAGGWQGGGGVRGGGRGEGRGGGGPGGSNPERPNENNFTFTAERIFGYSLLDVNRVVQIQVWRFIAVYVLDGRREIWFYPDDVLCIVGGVQNATAESVKHALMAVRRHMSQAPEGSCQKFKSEYKALTASVNRKGMLSSHYEHTLVTEQGMLHLARCLEPTKVAEVGEDCLSWLTSPTVVVVPEPQWEISQYQLVSGVTE